MSRAESIYPIRKQMERQLSLVESDPHNKEILTRYYKVRSTEVAPATVLSEFIRLNMMSRILDKRFEDATLQDIEDLIFKIDQRKNKDNTKNKFRKILKNFYKWMKGMRGMPKGVYPPEVGWITLKKVPLVTVTAGDLLPYDECVRISEFAPTLRDKSLFQCKLDAGCRIGEILTAKIGEVKFNDAGAILYSDGKTGYQPLILTWSAKTLAQWLNIHPFRHDKDAPVFCLIHSKKLEQMSYDQARMIFKECVKRAGHTRRVWLHLLKHVSSSEDAVKGLPDTFRRYKHHWTQNSKMPAVYEHLSPSIISSIQRETWSKVFGQNNHAEEKQDAPLQLVKPCRRCSYENSRDLANCDRCGYCLDDNKATERAVAKTRVEELLNRLMQEPEKVDKLLALVKS